MPFRKDYFRNILERIEETAEERAEEGTGGRAPDSIERIDHELVDYYRERPEALRTTLDEDILDPRNGFDAIGDMFSLRTGLILELRESGLDDATVLFLARSLLVGVERVLEDRTRLPALPNLLADILRQERITHALSLSEVGEAWRILFEIEREREHFANAEDALFHALELAEAPEELIRRGLDFYNELMDYTDAQLHRGGLEREEVDRARWELVERLDALL